MSIRLFSTITTILPFIGFCHAIWGTVVMKPYVLISGIVLSYSVLIARQSRCIIKINHYATEETRAIIGSTAHLVKKLCIGIVYLIMSVTLLKSIILTFVAIATLLILSLLLSPTTGVLCVIGKRSNR